MATNTFADVISNRLPGLLDEDRDMLVEELMNTIGGDTSDGHHTFDELYHYRALYNAMAFNLMAEDYTVVKSRLHHDGEFPFGKDHMFIVHAELPNGQVSNHYNMKYWNHFHIPEVERAPEYDGHTPEIAAHRMETFVKHVQSGNRINPMQSKVRQFQAAMGQPVKLWPEALPADRVPVRIELIREEFEDELMPALETGDLVETVDACIDLMYGVLGLMVEIGVNAEPLFNEVHASNMSKLGADGKPIIAGPNDPDGIFEGWVKKGPNYFRPDISAMIHLGGEVDLGRF